MWAIKEKLQNISSVLISKLSGRYGETYLKKKKYLLPRVIEQTH